MPDGGDQSRPALLIDLMLHGLRVTDGRLNAVAAALLCQLDGEILQRLIRVAADARNTPAHRARALAVVGRIGPPYGDGLPVLVALCRARNAAVRAAARDAFGLAGGMAVPPEPVSSARRVGPRRAGGGRA